ncbi:hypothetical protein [Leucobacter komagatae]|uniref:hypothetical protein n=1 Tax=Leucobacter komagatae TaxID=55969 RepID=UPI00115306BC|nr:hypothetical protein [Leucobacter komagatae]
MAEVVALEPGQGLQLDSDVDDATSILRMVTTLQGEREWLGQSLHDRILKEVIWFKWEYPRLPRPLIDGKYPCAYPWSALARETYQRSPKRAGRAGQLVIEHVVPKRELMAMIAEQAASLTPSGLAHLMIEGCRAVVITKDEDRLLTRAGLGHVRSNKDDVWSRYRDVGLDLSTFTPLEV